MGIGPVWLLQLPAYILPMLRAQKRVVANIFSLVEYEHYLLAVCLDDIVLSLCRIQAELFLGDWSYRV